MIFAVFPCVCVHLKACFSSLVAVAFLLLLPLLHIRLLPRPFLRILLRCHQHKTLLARLLQTHCQVLRFLLLIPRLNTAFLSAALSFPRGKVYIWVLHLALPPQRNAVPVSFPHIYLLHDMESQP